MGGGAANSGMAWAQPRHRLLTLQSCPCGSSVCLAELAHRPEDWGCRSSRVGPVLLRSCSVECNGALSSSADLTHAGLSCTYDAEARQ